jgi:hypothetical protein
MSEIKAILLVPAEDDPHGLLAEGPCGARPPLACWDGERWRSWTDNGWWWPVVPGRRALVLAWGGKTVAEGLDRANRVWVGRWCGYLLDWSVDDVREYGAALVIHLGGGTLVLLDAEGREVSNA